MPGANDTRPLIVMSWYTPGVITPLLLLTSGPGPIPDGQPTATGHCGKPANGSGTGDPIFVVGPPEQPAPEIVPTIWIPKQSRAPPECAMFEFTTIALLTFRLPPVTM